MARLLLAGYFGCGNLGDDAILAGFSEGVDTENVELSVMSGSPEETFRVYGMRAIPRMDFKAFQGELEFCDALVFPGGSIFQDVTSVKSAAYYANLVSRAKSAKKKVIMLGQGVGPLSSFFGKRFAISAFNDADVVVVRDPGSAQLLRDLGIKRPVQVAADMAFLMKPPADSDDSTSFSVGDMKTIGIAPRPWGKETKNIIKLFGELARMMFQSNLMPVLIEMDQANDRELIGEISKTQGGKVPDLRKLYSPMQVQQRISRMEAVIGMRLHAGILAASANVPPFMISYDPKVNAFSKLMGLPPPPSIVGLTAPRLFDSFMSFLKDSERNKKLVEIKRKEQQKLAELNIEAMLTCLKGSGSAR
jgi:polysaccharide pyruvyl transferase CsaB